MKSSLLRRPKPSSKLVGIRRFLRPFEQRWHFEKIAGDVLSNVYAGLLTLLFAGVLLTNSTYQFSLFTAIRNSFVSPGSAYAEIAPIQGLALDDATILKAGETRSPGGNYDILASAIEAADHYAVTVPGRPVVVGVDYVFNSVEEPAELERLVTVLSHLNDNTLVVLGAVLDQSGTETGYFRFDLYRDQLLNRVRVARGPQGEAYVAQHLFVGNLNLLKGNAVSGFQELENTDLALGYLPISSQAGVSYYSLPFMMYMLGEIVPLDDLRQGRFAVSADGYLSYDCDADLWLRPTLNLGQTDFTNRVFRYNFFSAEDLSGPSLLRFNYYPVRRLVAAYDTSGQTVNNLATLMAANALGLSQQGIGSLEKTKADYFFIYRPPSVGYLTDNTSKDVMATPASQRDEFTNSLQTVSGAMAHVTALSNLLRHSYVTDTPSWLEVTLTLVLAAFSIWLGSWGRLRSILLGGTALVLGVLLLSFWLFLADQFFACRTPLVVSLSILAVLSCIRFALTQWAGDDQ